MAIRRRLRRHRVAAEKCARAPCPRRRHRRLVRGRLTIQGDYLRGHPRLGPHIMMADGYATFLRIPAWHRDSTQHFTQRKRSADMLEPTALIRSFWGSGVSTKRRRRRGRGSVGEVIGKNHVHVLPHAKKRRRRQTPSGNARRRRPIRAGRAASNGEIASPIRASRNAIADLG